MRIAHGVHMLALFHHSQITFKVHWLHGRIILNYLLLVLESHAPGGLQELVTANKVITDLLALLHFVDGISFYLFYVFTTCFYLEDFVVNSLDILLQNVLHLLGF